jgi:transcription-repair coupling factor (superfamily II helicase)
MNIDHVAQTFLHHPHCKAAASALAAKGLRLAIEGTIGSGTACVVQAIARAARVKSHLIVLNDKEEAAYFLNDMQRFAHLGLQVYFYPESYRVPYTTEQTDNSNVVLRTEVLNALSQPMTQPAVVVSYPEALSENVVTRQQLQSHTFAVEVGGKYSIGFINELLTEYEFHREDFVYEPGQFSIRGGIVDVFSYGEEQPFRIEFFGDEVESIRPFDPSTQLSEGRVTRFTIVPNVQTQSLLESNESFLQFMGAEAVIWYRDPGFIAERLNQCFARAEKQYAALHSPLKHLPPQSRYLAGSTFAERLALHPQVTLGKNRNATQVYTFEQSPQPVFHKNFELLIKQLNENSAAGYTNYIFSGNEKQTDRLAKIFADLDAKVKFTAVQDELSEGFTDRTLAAACYTDHQIFERYHRFQLKEGFRKSKEALTIKELSSLQPGDFVTHIDHGVGRFSGLEKIDVNGKEQEAIRLVYRDGDILYVSIHSLHRISKYSGKEGTEPNINKLGSGAWQKAKAKTKSRVKQIAYDLIKLYAERKAKKGYAFTPDSYLQTELEASFIYEDTPDQLKATQAVKEDMEAQYPMDRLICGDVGFGKTEIAIRAAFKAVCDSKQVAVLVPTTILSIQHYKNFSQRLKEFPCRVAYINRFLPAKKQSEILKDLEAGKIDIIIGTHKLVGSRIKFKDLGLLIIDEEQKFGVAVKDRLKTLKANVDTLTLTATPIPRTLQFSLMGARDLSIISTPPPNRFPVQTELFTFNEEVIRDAVSYEVSRGGQVFFVNNKIQNIKEITGMIQRLCPDVRIAMGHGQMDGETLEEVMSAFIDGAYDVLVATTIIESGIDIPNANTIIINEANEFGLSDLHQLRGRVGRSNKKAFCYLLAPPLTHVTAEARKRLEAITRFSDLGSGLNIAMRDLDIRGAGNLFGGEQSGFINDLGFETYQKILDEAIRELKEEEFKDLYQEEREKDGAYVTDCILETDLEILIPDAYITDIAERLSIYRDIDNLTDEAALLRYRDALIDRFGPLPEQTETLLDAVRLRWMARDIGFEKLTIKAGKLIAFFTPNEASMYFESSAFNRVLDFIKSNPAGYKMYEKNGQLRLAVHPVSEVNQAIAALSPLTTQVSTAVH